MGTTVRPELSVNNKYWIEKHRYYELKHFCLQYPVWKKSCITLDGSLRSCSISVVSQESHPKGDPTVECAETRAYFAERIALVERVAKEAADELSDYILKGVTEGVSYDHLKAKLEIPCCKDKYYELYRRFFFLLSKEKQ